MPAELRGIERLEAVNREWESYFRRTMPRQVQSLGIAYSPTTGIPDLYD